MAVLIIWNGSTTKLDEDKGSSLIKNSKDASLTLELQLPVQQEVGIVTGKAGDNV